ncbi:MAG: class I SAM-dependent methyltransferase, partial [Candidatus Eisenbacteria bacterium]
MSFYTDFAEHYERIFPLREETFAFLAAALPRGGRRVLDVGCGSGHYCGRFATQGLDAVGIDLDAAMIAAAHDRYPAAHFERLDMRGIGTLAGPFDLVFCIGNTLAHLPQEALPAFLAALHRLLAPDGRWVLQVVNWDRILAAGREEFPVLRFAGGIAFHREYRDLSEERVRFITRLEAGSGVCFAGEADLYPVR